MESHRRQESALPSVARMCTAALALVLLGGCSQEGARLRVAFRTREPLTVSMLRMRIDDGKRTYQLGPSDFVAEPAGAADVHRSRELPTLTRGTLRMEYALVAASGDTASRGQVELPLRSDWVYSIEVVPDTSDPAQRCFGCQGSRAFGLAGAYVRPGVHTVYVIWGGNSISDPVIY